MAFPTTILVDRNGNIVGEPMLGGIDNKDNYDALMTVSYTHLDVYKRQGFWNHQHAAHRNSISQQYNRNIECKAQDNWQPHPTKRAIIIFFCTCIETSDEKSTIN